MSEREDGARKVVDSWFETQDFAHAWGCLAAFPHWPVTSVRRSLTNATSAGLLRHHAGDRRLGPWGAAESTWEAIG